MAVFMQRSRPDLRRGWDFGLKTYDSAMNRGWEIPERPAEEIE
jgi:hypothetical protein